MNVEGIWSTIKNFDLYSHVSSYDFVLFTETFSDSFPEDLFPDFEIFLSPSIKLSESIHGRTCGGLAFLVKKALELKVQQVQIEYDNMMVFSVHDNKNSGFKEVDVFTIVCVYLPPENSPYYMETEIHNGVTMLENALLDIGNVCDCSKMMIVGDLNARTGEENGYMSDYSNIHHLDRESDSLVENPHNQRCSKDKGYNAFGKFLLNVCSNFDLSIVNGIKHKSKEFSSDFTYVTSMGSSVIDLFLVSNDMLCFCNKLSVFPLIESKHAAVSMWISLFDKNVDVCKNECRPSIKYRWNDDKSKKFNEVLNSNDVKTSLKNAINRIDIDMNDALKKFNDCMYKAAECMLQKVHFRSRPRNIWFDLECAESRRIVRNHLRHFYRYNNDDDRLAYAEKRKEYKQLLVKKKNDKKNEIVQKLKDNLNDPNVFWSCIKSCVQSKQMKNCISMQEWYDHFCKVFRSNCKSFETRSENNIGVSATEYDLDNQNNLDLDEKISEEEIKSMINSLKNNKAAGPDCLINEFYRNGAEVIMPFLLKFFNLLFDKSIFPLDWSLSILQPLHKKGPVSDPDNYRGISLLNVCSKIYSGILNRRLNDWLEINDVLGEEQAGYRRSRSSLEQIFVLYSIVNKQLVKHKKLYVAFIDFKKAFDCVSREKLWPILRKNGISLKMLKALKSMYQVVKTKVRVNGQYTESLDCPLGLKQGEICSPVIFSLFIHELTKEIRKKGKHGVQLSPEMVQILILLFADDVALIADSIGGLQNQLNILHEVAIKLDLEVNLNKSNIVVFRNGGHLAKTEKWLFNGENMLVVNAYKYLGIFLTTKLCFTQTFEDLAMKAKKGIIGILRTLWSIGEHSPAIFFKLFDCQITPILTYGAEIWGLSGNQEIIERVHLFALKRFLGVHPKTPRHLVYGDTGRYPLYVITYTKCIKFWLNLTRQNNGRFSKKAYNMLMQLQQRNYTTWVDKVRNTLYYHGFGIVWENQGVGNIEVFIKLFRQRLIDCAGQNWNGSIISHDFYSSYASFKTNFGLESYLNNVPNFWHRRSLSRFRFGMSEINCSALQFKPIPRKNRLCFKCVNQEETEFHFLLVCPCYQNLRSALLPDKFFRQPNLFKSVILMASQSEYINRNLAEYVYRALLTRAKLVEQIQ